MKFAVLGWGYGCYPAAANRLIVDGNDLIQVRPCFYRYRNTDSAEYPRETPGTFIDPEGVEGPVTRSQTFLNL